MLVTNYMHSVGLKQGKLVFGNQVTLTIYYFKVMFYIKTIDLLLAGDLPCLVKIYELEFDVTFLGLETGQASLIPGDPFLRTYVPGHNVDDFLLFISGFTIAVITKGPNFYLFDSHSRDHRGLSVPDGTSVLLRFKDLFEIEKYIQVAYLEYRDLQHSSFSTAVY